MVSIFSIEWYNDDGTPTWDVVTTHRFRIDKANTANLTNPVPIPTAGTNRSHWANFRLAWTAPDSQVDNIRIYPDAALGWGAGVIVVVGESGDADGDGIPTGEVASDPATAGFVGTILTSHTSIPAMSDFYATYSSGTPLTIDTNAYAGADVSKHVQFGVEVGPTAIQGLKGAETVTYLADEI